MKSYLKSVVKQAGLAAATVLIAPLLLLFWIESRFMGRDRALQGCSQALSLVPGYAGQFLRRAFLTRVLAECDPTVTVEFGSTFSRAGAKLGRHVYIGSMCHIGLAEIGDDAMLASGVHVPSGPLTHGISDLTTPMRDQPGSLRRVRIGSGAWIGSAAVVLADVGQGAVVMAGSVVTKPIAALAVAGGNPARAIMSREDAAETSEGRLTTEALLH